MQTIFNLNVTKYGTKTKYLMFNLINFNVFIEIHTHF